MEGCERKSSFCNCIVHNCVRSSSFGVSVENVHFPGTEYDGECETEGGEETHLQDPVSRHFEVVVEILGRIEHHSHLLLIWTRTQNRKKIICWCGFSFFFNKFLSNFLKSTKLTFRTNPNHHFQHFFCFHTNLKKKQTQKKTFSGTLKSLDQKNCIFGCALSLSKQVYAGANEASKKFRVG